MFQLVMPRVQAWERLNDFTYSGRLGMDALYELMIAAGYSEEAAQKAATERGNSRLDTGAPA